MSKRKASEIKEREDGEWSARYVCDPNAALAILDAAEKVGAGSKEVYLVCGEDGITFRAADGGRTRLLEAFLGTPNACILSGKPSPLCFNTADFALILKRDKDTVCCIDLNSTKDEISVFFWGDLENENVFQEMLSFNFDEGAHVTRFELKKFDFSSFPTDEVGVYTAFSLRMPAAKVLDTLRSATAFGAEKLFFEIDVSRIFVETDGGRKVMDETVVAMHSNGRVKTWERLKWVSPLEKGCHVKYEESMRGGSVENFGSAHKKAYSARWAYGIKSLNAALSSFTRGDLLLSFDRKEGHLLVKFPVDANAVITVLIGADAGE